MQIELQYTHFCQKGEEQKNCSTHTLLPKEGGTKQLQYTQDNIFSLENTKCLKQIKILKVKNM